jgi:hypothetical protein
MRTPTSVFLLTAALAGVVAGLVAGPAWAVVRKPKYYFNVADVSSPAPVDDATRAAAKELLENELKGRPEFTQELGGASGPDDVVAELKRRKLQGFNVTLKLESYKRDPKPPRPGGVLKVLSVGVRLSVFGTTIPEAKLAFGGDGEATVEAEVVERKLEEEATSLTRDVLAQAIKQAVDQAVAKLSLPKSKPFNESKRKRAK